FPRLRRKSSRIASLAIQVRYGLRSESRRLSPDCRISPQTLARRGPGNLSSRHHGVAVNGHCIFQVVRIAAGVSDHHGYVARVGGAKDKLVALLQACD